MNNSARLFCNPSDCQRTKCFYAFNIHDADDDVVLVDSDEPKARPETLNLRIFRKTFRYVTTMWVSAHIPSPLPLIHVMSNVYICIRILVGGGLSFRTTIRKLSFNPISIRGHEISASRKIKYHALQRYRPFSDPASLIYWQ